MKMSKVIKPLLAVVGVGALGYVSLKRKKSSRAVSNIVKVASDAIINAEKSFGGLKQSVIDEVVSNTPRGVKAVVDGDTLEYWFKSASGKKTPTARIAFDSAGELVFTFLSFSDANSPRFFIANLRDAMNKAK